MSKKGRVSEDTAIGVFFASAMALGVFFIGLKAGYNYWLNLASGATIVLTAAAIFFLCFVFSPKRRRHQASAKS